MVATFCTQCYGLTQKNDEHCQKCGKARPSEGWPGDPLLGTVFEGEYTIMRRLGRGGFGVVYLAENKEFGAKRAIKILHQQHVHSDRILRRFKREAKALYRLQSPYTVRLERWGRTESGQHYMIMEFAQGENLRDLLTREGSLGELQALNVARQIGVALADAHALEILHRDLKPENIVVRTHPHEGFRIAVLDFGIAKILSDDTDSHHSGIMGTPSYMAPEVWKPTLGPTDIRADLWSLGIVMYEMLVGKLPYTEGSTSDPIATAYEACNIDTEAIESRLGAVPTQQATKDLVTRLIQPRPQDRFLDPAAFLSQLDQHPIFQQARQSDQTKPSLGRGKHDQARKTGVPLSTFDETLSVDHTYEEREADNFTFLDEPPEDLRLKTSRTSQTGLPNEAKPNRLRTIIVALILLGLIALMARFGERLLEILSPQATNATSDPTPREPDQPQHPTPSSTLLAGDGMTMHLIAGGAFSMGSDQVASASPAHLVRLDPFYLDQYPVSVSMWQRCVELGACPPEEALLASEQSGCRLGLEGTLELPMNCLSWLGAESYCLAQNRRLPTEAEWERAARGPENELWPPWINPESESHREPAPGEDSSIEGPIGMGWGELEWVADWYSSAYYQASPVRNPLGPFSGFEKTLRGGLTGQGRPLGWVGRAHLEPSERLPQLGFRCAMSQR